MYNRVIDTVTKQSDILYTKPAIVCLIHAEAKADSKIANSNTHQF